MEIDEATCKWMVTKPLKCSVCRAVVRHEIGCHYPDGEEQFIQRCLRCKTVSVPPER
jgi:hypothetical protein